MAGIDRATFNDYAEAEHQAEAPLQQQHTTSLSNSSDSDGQQVSSHSRSKGLANVRRFSEKLKSRAKRKTTNIFQSPKQSQVRQHQIAPILAPAPSSENDDDRLFNAVPEHTGPQAKDLFHHPVDTVQSVMHGASGEKMASVMDNQSIAHGADVNLVRAHDKVGSTDDGEDRHLAIRELQELKKARQDTYVRWTMDRHVLKVRRMPPHDSPRPQKKDFTVPNQNGLAQIQWAQYGQHLARFYARQYGDQYIDESPNLPPATEEAINTGLERLLMASMPFQVLLMQIRHLYRWEDPTETALWFAGYIICWAVGQLGGAAIMVTLWIVIRRRLTPPSLEDLRENIRRSEDIELTATSFTQLIEQHGSRGWVAAVINDLGPRALLQIEDMADALEIMRNFYEWRSPRQTILSLAMLGMCLAYVTFTPLWLLIKATQLSLALVFFGLFPIASWYPQYRVLVSPLTWLFWKIPTDAEWAIARLQVEARHNHKTIHQADVKHDQDTAENEKGSLNQEENNPTFDIGRYHCKYENHHGDLHVNSAGVYYITAVRSNLLWELRFENVKTIQKTKSNEGLHFVLTGGTEFLVTGLKLQQEVFTQIIGYSNMKWQVTG